MLKPTSIWHVPETNLGNHHNLQNCIKIVWNLYISLIHIQNSISYSARTPTLLLVSINVDKIHVGCTWNWFAMDFHLNIHLFILLHPLLDLDIVDALRFTKSQYDLRTIDFDNMNVHDVKYLPPSFEWNIWLCCPHYLWMNLMYMVVLWMSWPRCAIDNRNAQ